MEIVLFDVSRDQIGNMHTTTCPTRSSHGRVIHSCNTDKNKINKIFSNTPFDVWKIFYGVTLEKYDFHNINNLEEDKSLSRHAAGPYYVIKHNLIEVDSGALKY